MGGAVFGSKGVPDEEALQRHEEGLYQNGGSAGLDTTQRDPH